jgi:hypothetical protein
LIPLDARFIDTNSAATYQTQQYLGAPSWIIRFVKSSRVAKYLASSSLSR